MRLTVVAGILASVVVGLSAQSEQAVLDAQQQLQTAISKADKAAAGKLLDPEFTWTNWIRGVRPRAQVLDDMKAPVVGTDSEVKAHIYGQLAVVTGTYHQSGTSLDARFMRVWVNQSGRWKALLHQGVPMETGAAIMGPTIMPANGAPDLTVPFKGHTPQEQQVVAAYVALRKATSAHDASAFANLTADEFAVIPPTGAVVSKQERIDTLKKQASGPATAEGKVQMLDVKVFGDAAVMVGDELPPIADVKPYHFTRVWVKRGGRWQQAINVMTTLPTGGKPTTH